MKVEIDTNFDMTQVQIEFSKWFTYLPHVCDGELADFINAR